jgi:transaldolase
MNQLEALSRMTTVVADTGDVEAIARHRPQDATTNPSLLLASATLPESRPLVEAALAEAGTGAGAERSARFIDALSVAVGCRILELIPGRVSTEVPARLSFDTGATVDRAQRLIAGYEAHGIGKERVLIKIAATWEGIRAAELLEREGIHCNLTLLFSFGQAVACAEAGVTLISPFVGRIYDWYRAKQGGAAIPVEDDPGVASVRRIFDYYKRHGYPTEVMGASFRHAGQVLALAGCDLLTISPELLAELAASDAEVLRRLDPALAVERGEERCHLDEKTFRWELNEDAMASDKLAEGIRRFHADAAKLERWAFEALG